MEISRLQDLGVKIKTKTVTIALGAEAPDAEVEIKMGDDSKYFEKSEGEKLVIKGPGDYEVRGVTISGERLDEDTIYRINDGQYTIVVTNSTSAAKIEIEEDENVGAVVLRLNSKFDEGVAGPLSTSLMILYGEEANAPQKSLVKKDKVNLKKRDELESNIVFLSK